MQNVISGRFVEFFRAKPAFLLLLFFFGLEFDLFCVNTMEF